MKIKQIDEANKSSIGVSSEEEISEIKLMISVQSIKKDVPLLKIYSPTQVVVSRHDGSKLTLPFLNRKMTSLREAHELGRVTFRFSNLDVVNDVVSNDDEYASMISHSTEDVMSFFKNVSLDQIKLLDEHSEEFKGVLSISFASIYMDGGWTQLKLSSSGATSAKWTTWTIGTIESLTESEIKEINDYLGEHLSFYVESKVATAYYLSIYESKDKLFFDQEYDDQSSIPGEEYLMFYPNYREYFTPVTFREMAPVPFLLKEGDDSNIIFSNVVSCLREDGFPKEKDDIYYSLQRAAELYAHRED